MSSKIKLKHGFRIYQEKENSKYQSMARQEAAGSSFTHRKGGMTDGQKDKW